MTYKKKLIEVALPLAKINFESAREKSIRHGHPSTLHLWWARRPLAAARAVLWSSLVDDPSAHPDKFPTDEDQAIERRRLFDILERLVPWEATTDEKVLQDARAEIVNSCEGELPKILDPFGGGGAIPLEALRLGLPTFSGDLNPVAVLIQRAMIEIPAKFAGSAPVFEGLSESSAFWEGSSGLAADVDAYGTWLLERARELLKNAYPDVKLPDGSSGKPIAWIWARTIQSPDPSWLGHVPLVRSWELVKKPGKPTIWVKAHVDSDTREISYEVVTGGTPNDGNVNRQGATCIATGSTIPLKMIKEAGKRGELGEQLLAVVAESSNGRVYVSPGQDQIRAAGDISEALWQPTGSMSDHPQYMGTFRYGIDEWWKMFTRRQLVSLTVFSDLLKVLNQKVLEDALKSMPKGEPLSDGGRGAIAYAGAIQTYLAFALDRLADRNSTSCSWDSTRMLARNVFARQAIPMTWDFAESNPLSQSAGSWSNCVRGITKAIINLPITSSVGNTAQRDARSRVTEIEPHVLMTDPPYYDNVPYSDLSDFFYVWMRRNLPNVWPDELSTLLTPKADELVANHVRQGSHDNAKTHFESGMTELFSSAIATADDRYPAAVFYAFKATESEGSESTGWETFLNALLQSGWTITATWPMRTELGNRMRAVGSNALATSIVLSCRKRNIAAAMATRGEFISALRTEMAPAVKILQVENIAPVDMAQSAIGPGIGIFSRYSKVVEADGQNMTVRTALSLINEVLAEVLSGEESEFDADTRFAVTWYEQFGHNPGAFGDADTLAKAKNTTVGGVVESGIAVSKEGKLRLLERNEMSDSWNPKNDTRLTVWETTQYLIRALEQSESIASDLMKQIGSGFGERARQLAYLLYGICDRKKWASEGSAYNMLIAAWPEIEKLARQETKGDSSPETLF
ncbi:MAG: DUF1156 domain-containing protein [Actinobacteria bacterium]|nr:DUF1156 domain-containing protein [Actinomycetota bacterium]